MSANAINPVDQSPVTLTPGNAQWIGARGEQQDAFGFHGFEDQEFRAHGGLLAVLADGMGGLKQGRAAAQIAVTTFREAYAEKTPEESIPDALGRALAAANAAVHQLAVSSDGEGQVGTTLVAAVAHEKANFWIAVGDSRVYSYRADRDTLTLLNQEHNYAAILQARVAEGALEQAAADENPDRAALTSFLGLEAIPRIDAGTDPMPLGTGDRLLLCSDGVHGTLNEEDLRQLIRQPAQKAAEAIIASVRAVNKTNQDNATLTIVGLDRQPPEMAKNKPGIQTTGQPCQRQPMSPWGKTIIGVGLSLLLVLIGIAIGLSFPRAQWFVPNDSADHVPEPLRIGPREHNTEPDVDDLGRSDSDLSESGSVEKFDEAPPIDPENIEIIEPSVEDWVEGR